MNKHRYYCNCVNWPESDVHSDGGLVAMIDSNRDITRQTFLDHVDRDDLANLSDQLGYVRHHTQGLTMAQDWAISYHKSKLHGKTVYYFRWSSIEYVFRSNDE